MCYWRDLDVQGLEILAVFRRNHPNAIALMMNNKTYNAHSKLIIPGETYSILRNPSELDTEESLLYSKLKEQNFRLEQEKISRSHLKEIILQQAT